ncbi:Testis-expressed sequence 11 protein [Liparis tanakae]|uniref:Protein ZIP4 homolog n=1 Tax=Liparis tanakae TaxID=230148 RepID=A0A4Z2HFB1_9TELE|nr:Testis-expressed sequence 11 protein [Liparis tanakae]
MQKAAVALPCPMALSCAAGSPHSRSGKEETAVPLYPRGRCSRPTHPQQIFSKGDIPTWLLRNNWWKLRADRGLTDNLLHKQPTDYDEVIEKLFSEVSGLKDFPKVPDQQLEECAIQLWNWAVTKNVGSTLSTNQKAKVRHVACSLLCCCVPENPTEGVIRKQILMASKTGRTWLDCKNPQMADNFLRFAVKSLETLYGQLTSRGDGAADNASSKGDVEKDLLRVLSCQAESAISQGNNHEAVVYMQRCKDMLLRLPQDTAYLSLMCYNFGIDTYNLGKFEESVFWLSQSYEIGKMNVKYAPGSEVQAKVLRLLGTVYLEWDCQRFQEKALNAVSLANKVGYEKYF